MTVLALLGRVPLSWWLLLAVAAWGGVGRLQLQSARAELASARLEFATAAAAAASAAADAQRQAREVEGQWADNTRRAADAYSQTATRLRVDAGRARDELGRLQRILAAPAAPASGAAAAPGPACRADDATNARLVVGRCAEALAGVAAAADQCEGRLSALQEWVRATR